jgi:hypothetical protein
VTIARYYSKVDQEYEVEFRESLASAIPLVTRLLEDKSGLVRHETVRSIGNLANHGER